MATKKPKAEVKEKKPAKKTTKIKEPANRDSGAWPKIVQGTHLTVKTFEDGKTELIWDWDALVNEVRAACLKAESNIPANTDLETMKPNVKAKVSTRKKKEAAMITAAKKSKK